MFYNGDDVAGWYSYAGHLTAYNAQINIESPLELNVGVSLYDGNYIISASTEVTGAITTDNNHIVFALTYEINDEYFCSVIQWSDEDFDLTTVGETQVYTAEFPYDEDLDITKIKGVAFVQDYTTKTVLQSGSGGFTGLMPMFSASINEGPAHLEVQFSDFSFPYGGVTSWEWDFDNDGTIDSNEQNPLYVYTTPGTYSVSLTISDGTDTDTATYEDYIIVGDGSNISGRVTGYWKTEFSPYQITGDTEISIGTHLIIDPGVEIQVSNEAVFNAYGYIEAIGTADSPIVFSSPDSWKGVKLLDNDQMNSFIYCNFTGATNGAINLDNSTATIKNCKFSQNHSSNTGAAIHVQNTDNVEIILNKIFNNSSTTGAGAILCQNADMDIVNNLIANNESSMAAGVSLKSSSVVNFYNNTFVNNYHSNPTMGGQVFAFSSTGTFVNNIIWGESIPFDGVNSTYEATYSNCSELIEGDGNISENPYFVDPTEGNGADFDAALADFNIQPYSPCVNAGIPDVSGLNLPAIDLLGNDRVLLDIIDIGAYESLTVNNDEITNDVPVISQIDGIYPNPFNSSKSSRGNGLTIKLNISEADQNNPVKVGVYNLIGQLVKTLNNEPLKAGERSLYWNGKDGSNNEVATGIYFVKIKSKTLSKTQKIMMIK